jgi:creatinine amidohydrolase
MEKGSLQPLFYLHRKRVPASDPFLIQRPRTLGNEHMGHLLEELSWLEAETLLGVDTVVVLPLGAAAKEHGPHLQLNNDWLIAEYLKRRVLEAADVVVAPTLGYHYYPAFVEYPGSVTLRLETARDLVVDVCTSLAAFGPRRFYALNTGVSTVRALQPAREELERKGLLLHFTDIHTVAADAVASVTQQDGGTHADEIETSMMLYIAAHSVDMSKAARDYHPGQGRLTRTAGTPGIYSPTGIFGDATLATREKGRIVVEAKVAGILADIARLRATPAPCL